MNNFKIIYESVYKRIIEEGKAERFDGSHAHRIIPGYLGGEYQEKNVIYLTQKNHSIIHWIRWKLFNDSRDYRAYKMIGVGPSGLSKQDRIDHGLYCAKTNIGIHGYDKDIRLKYSLNGYHRQKEIYEKTGQKNFYYWSTPEGRKERAKMGGKVGYKNNPQFIKNCGHFAGDKQKASEAAKKSGKKPVTNGKIVKKFKTDEELIAFLIKNPNWRKGCLTKKEKLALVK